jgi:hypothetical protein
MVDRLPGHLRDADLAVERYGDLGRASTKPKRSEPLLAPS